MGKCLTLKDRRTIASMYEAEANTMQIAVKVGVHPATIYDELRRGQSTDEDGNVLLDKNSRPKYDPVKANEVFQENIRRRGNRRGKEATNEN